MNLQPAEILQRIRKIEIRSRKLVNEILAGRYHSLFKGRGIEFSEVRTYAWGDDIRTIDWNVTARMGYPHVKLFVEERELTVYLVLDISASLSFGSFGRPKREVMAEIAALLAFSALTNNDKVGLILFTDEVESYLPPKKGKEYILRLLREILYFEPMGKKTNLSSALAFLGKVARKRGVVFIISDFYDEGYERDLKILQTKHDCLSIAIWDPVEGDPPTRGLVWYDDLEGDQEGWVDLSSSKVRKVWKERMRAFRERVHQTMQKAQVDFLALSASEDYEKPLIEFFARRAQHIPG